MFLGERSELLDSFFKTKTKEQGDLTSVLEDYKTFLLGRYATAPRCQYYVMRRTFDFLYLTEGKEKQKNIPCWIVAAVLYPHT